MWMELFGGGFLVGFDHTVMKLIQMLSLLGAEVMDSVFLAVTFLGEETFLVVLVLIVYWAVNKRKGEFLILALFTTLGLNGALKDVFRRPRPFFAEGFEDMRYVQADSSLVSTVSVRGSFSFPSGHSQSAGTLFSGLALADKRKRNTPFYVIAIVLVMVSRVYLGVHYPTDVLAGAALGWLAAVLAWGLFNQFYKQYLILLGLVIALSSLTLFIDFSGDTLKTVGLGLGAFVGLVMERELVDFRVEGGILGKLIRVVVGVGIVLALRLGLKAVLPEGMWFDALRYAAVGLSATWLWPWIFTKLGF